MGRRIAVSVVLALGLATLGPPGPASAIVPVGVSLAGPQEIAVGTTANFAGDVTLAVVGVPGVTVDLVVDDVVVSSANTGLDGSYAMAHPFAAPGVYSVQAVVDEELFQGSSPVILVRVGFFVLTVAKAGTGTGSVVSSPEGIDCGTDCTHSYAHSVDVELVAAPDTGSGFVGWSGACTGSGECIVSMSEARTVIATFADTEAPAIPVLTGTTPPSPANDNTPLIHGTAQPGSTVQVYTNAACTGAPTASGFAPGGAFSIGVSVPNDSSTTFYATATDAGGTSGCSAGLTYVEDSTPPAVPVLTGTAPGSPSNANNPFVMGTAPAGTTIRIYKDATCTGPVAGTGSAPSGAFSIQVSVPDNSTTTFRATASDAAGNTSACSAGLVYVEDSDAPAAPVLTGTTPASPANNNNPTVHGTAAPGSTIRLYKTSDCTGGFHGAIASGAGTFSIMLGVPDDSVTTFAATATDNANNTSACSAAITYVEDSTAPASPSITGSVPGSPANDNSPDIVGVAEAGSTVRLYTNASCAGAPLANGPATGGNFAIGVTVGDNTSTTYYADAIDGLAQVSPCSAGFTYVEDSIPPAAPVLTGTVPASPADDNQPHVHGTAELGVDIFLFTDPGCTGPGAGADTATNGPWSIQVAVPSDSTTTFYAKAVDEAGNESACSAGITYVEDSTTPLAPVITGASSGSPANDNNPSILGTGEAGTTITLYPNGTCTGAALTSGPAPGGNFALAVTVADDTSTTYSATSTDGVGHVSPCSNAFTYIEDSTAPVFAGLTSVTALSPTELMLSWSAATDAVTPPAAIAYDICRSTAEGACVTTFTIDTTAIGGTSTVIGGLAPGSRHFFVVRARDEAGNTETNTVERTGLTLSTRVVIDVAAGDDHTCALIVGGSVRCWGANARGQLGNGTTADSSTPVTILGLTDIVDIAAGGQHSCALSATGLVSCWGANGSGQLGDGGTADSPWPTPTSITDAISVAVGGDHTCAVHAAGTVSCWGANASGQLGDGTTTSSTTPVAVASLTDVLSVTAGAAHSCAVRATGRVHCWGENAAGQLGDGTTASSSSPVQVAGLTHVLEAAGGGSHSCALRSNGGVQCWGRNTAGQLGDGTTTDSATAVAAGGVVGATTVTAGHNHSCAVEADGQTRCWGDDTDGQLGDGAGPGFSATPVLVAVDRALAVAAGGSHTCVVRWNATAWCTGANTGGQLGNGSATATELPVAVTPPTATVGPRAISAGTLHTCAAMTDGTVRCWGDNGHGQLGVGSITESNVPVTVPGIGDATGVATGLGHTCALHSTGDVSCWGFNANGQLGDGTFSPSASPVAVAGLATATSVTAGYRFSCIRAQNGTGRCWGSNFVGQLGAGLPPGTNSTSPVIVTGLGTVRELAAGEFHACAARSNGNALCWGNNSDGGLGDGTNADSNVPVGVPLAADATGIAGGGLHTCAPLQGGSADCWGENLDGQLGNGANLDTNLPVSVSGLGTARAITTGYSHSCARLTDGAASCWGANGSGQLGDGTNVASNVPVAVGGLAKATAMAGGDAHTCAVVAAGSTLCWGANGSGQLGDGSFGASSSPVPVKHLP